MNNATKILLIKDNISDADLIIRVLTKNKLANKITHLNDGQEALEYFEEQMIDPDMEACYCLGVNSYVVKPVVFDEFVKTIPALGQYWLMVNEPLKKHSESV